MAFDALLDDLEDDRTESAVGVDVPCGVSDVAESDGEQPVPAGDPRGAEGVSTVIVPAMFCPTESLSGPTVRALRLPPHSRWPWA